MNIQKITTALDTVAKKGAAELQQVSKKISQNRRLAKEFKSEKLASSLDCLAAGKKPIFKMTSVQTDTKSIGKALQSPELKSSISVKKIYMPNTAKSFAHEAVYNGSNAQEAVNSAKAAMAAISKPVGFSAKQSAQTFIEAGPSQLERKLDLQEKYGKKLQETKAQKAADALVRNKSKYTIEQLLKVDELLK